MTAIPIDAADLSRYYRDVLTTGAPIKRGLSLLLKKAWAPCVLLATLASSSVQAQSTFTLAWSGQSNQEAARPVISPNGRWVITPSANSLKLFDMTTGRFIQTLAFGSLNGATFSADSSRLLVAANNRVYSYTASTGAGPTVVLTDLATSAPSTSRDGRFLAYLTQDASANPELAVYDLTTSAQAWRIPLSGPKTSTAFTADSTRVVVDGPEAWNLVDGTVAYSWNALVGPFRLSPDGTRVYGVSSTLTDFEARNVADGSLIWSTPYTPPAPGLAGGFGLTASGDRVLLPVRHPVTGAGHVDIFTSGGVFIARTTPSSMGALGSGHLSIETNPALNNQYVLTQRDSFKPVAFAEAFRFNVVTGATIFSRSFSSLFFGIRSMAISRTNHPVPNQPVVAVGGTTGGLQVRNAVTGALFIGASDPKTTDALNSIALSPDGTRLVLCGELAGITGIHVWEVPTGALISSVPDPSALSAAFVDADTFVVSHTTNFLRSYELGSGGVTPGAFVVAATASPIIAVDDAGTMVITRHANRRQVIRTMLAGGQTTISVAAIGGSVEYLAFDEAGVLYAGLINPPATQAMRLFNVVGVPSTIRTITRPLTRPLGTQSWAAARRGDWVSMSQTMDSPDARRVGDISKFSLPSGANLYRFLDQQVAEGTSTLGFLPDSSLFLVGRTDPALYAVQVPGAVSTLTLNPATVKGASSTTGTVTLTAPAPLGGLIVRLESNNARVTVPLTVLVPARATSVNFPVTVGTFSADTTATLTARVSTNAATAVLQIEGPDLTTFDIAASTTPSGTMTLGTVTLDSPAGVGGVTVDLTYSGATGPATLSILEGQTTGSFAVTANVVDVETVATVEASLSGVTLSDTFQVTVAKITQILIGQASVRSGLNNTATIAFDGLVSTDQVVDLLSSDPIATVPATATVLANENWVMVHIPNGTTGVDVPVTISATHNALTVTGTYTVTPPAPVSVTFSLNPVPSGTASVGTVTVNGIAPTGGLVVNLASNNTAAVVPATVTIPAGATTATFPITNGSVSTDATVTVTATFGTASASGQYVLRSPFVSSLVLNRSTVMGGTPVTATMTISAPAPTGGLAVPLSSTHPAVASVPAQVIVPAGATTTTFTITTSVVTVNTAVTITATRPHGSRSRVLTVVRPR